MGASGEGARAEGQAGGAGARARANDFSDGRGLGVRVPGTCGSACAGGGAGRGRPRRVCRRANRRAQPGGSVRRRRRRCRGGGSGGGGGMRCRSALGLAPEGPKEPAAAACDWRRAGWARAAQVAATCARARHTALGARSRRSAAATHLIRWPRASRGICRRRPWQNACRRRHCENRQRMGQRAPRADDEERRWRGYRMCARRARAHSSARHPLCSSWYPTSTKGQAQQSQRSQVFRHGPSSSYSTLTAHVSLCPGCASRLARPRGAATGRAHCVRYPRVPGRRPAHRAPLLPCLWTGWRGPQLGTAWYLYGRDPSHGWLPARQQGASLQQKAWCFVLAR